MRTQVIPEHALGLPWLEHFGSKGGPAEKTILDKSPFVIGRGEAADLQVVSQGVSREHAAMVREGGATRIRDLGSTNGTFVNGQRTKESELHDGDMVQVADVEFTFYCGKSQDRRGTVTQVLALDADADADDHGNDAAGELRRAVRGLHETLVSGCVKASLKPIVDLHQGQVAGYEPADDDVPSTMSTWCPSPQGNLLLPVLPGRVAVRLRHLRRLRGLEQAAAMPGKPFIFMNIPSAEAASGRLLELASLYSELLTDASRLVIAVPYGTAKEIAGALAPGGWVRELGVAVALSDLGGREADMALLAEIRPDFVRLAASLVRGIQGYSKSLRTIQAMIRAVGESGTRVIAAGISSPAERAACLEVGCELGQGPLFDERKRADALPRKAGLKGFATAQDAFYLSLALDSIER